MSRSLLVLLVVLAGSSLAGAVAYAQLSDSQTASGVINAAPGAQSDFDNDRCPNPRELVTGVGVEVSGGNRDPKNPWDYFNPSYDGQNRVDDILLVVDQYFIDEGNPNYTIDTDRTLTGPNAWNLGTPNGLQRVDDILNSVYQYFHDCA
jgi:hypothetical protein